jgi:heme exporter protein D
MTYFGYVLASYLVSAGVIGALIVWVMLDGRAQARALEDLDRAGIRRGDATDTKGERT